jgi:Zn-dependent protease with chaperone function
LEKLEADPSAVQSSSRATAHLWIASPHPPIDERIRVLKEL